MSSLRHPNSFLSYGSVDIATSCIYAHVHLGKTNEKETQGREEKNKEEKIG
jgi:hypothetical protein